MATQSTPNPYPGLIGAEIGPGPQLNPLQELLRKSKTAQMIRGLANSVVPGVSLDSQFQPDLYNPFTGSGRRDYANGQDLNPDANLTENISNLGQMGASGASSGLKKALNSRELASLPAVEMMYKNKSWDAIPDAMKQDPKFLQEAVQQFEGMNKGRAIPKGLSEVPKLKEAAPATGAKGMIDALGNKSKSALAGVAKGYASNPVGYKTGMSSITGLVNEAANSKDKEAQLSSEQSIETLPETTVPSQATQQSVQPSQPSAPKPSSTDEMLRIMAGNKGLTPYQPKEKHGIASILDKIARTVNPVDTEAWDQEAAMRDYQRQMMERGYIDPQTQMLLKQAGLDADVTREVDAKRQMKPGAQEFGLRYAPAMQPNQLEELYGLPAGSIDGESLRRLGAEKKLDPMDVIMMQLIQNMQGGSSVGNFSNSQEPVINIPGAKR